ncbi:DNA cytosine methyltransferase [Niabella sp.]|uniref:DNA cytosine methyltransferase n=1 Tax=Niabella sp. TaxID=1962976 RepID=UPI0026161F64|nr:DNA (cytosine-5-)-methyltransferase [Niabella sp.]
MRHGSLFSGIGGFDLAALWMGWVNIFNVEIDPFCRRVLKFHFPFTIQFDDIRKFNAKRYYGSIDIISGGFPCQPFSLAGRRRGMSDDRYLWPEMLRVIDEIRPTWFVGENVAGILSMVQPGVPVNLGSQAGFGKEDQEIITEHEYIVWTICKDIERIGYSVQPFVIPACGAGAPHRRNRIWFIAHSNGILQYPAFSKESESNSYQKWPALSTGFTSVGGSRIITNSHSAGLERTTGPILSSGKDGQSSRTGSIPTWESWPTESPVCRRNDGISSQLVDISFSKWRKESLRSFGNAIVPQVAYQIFQSIDQTHRLPGN